MSKYMIQGETLTGIADAIRAKTGSTEAIAVGDMATAIEGVKSGGFPNGTTVDGWVQTNVTKGRTNYICEYDGLCIACMSTGLWYSEDGKTWTQSNVIDVDMRCVTKTKTILVAGGSSGVFYSEDGKEWAPSDSISSDVNTVISNDGLFLAGVDNGGIWYSEDGRTWVQSNLNTNYVNDIAYGDGMWVAGVYYNKGIWYSKDGKTWTQSDFPSNYTVRGSGPNTGIVYAKGRFVAAPSGSYPIYYSDDGTTWTAASFGNRSTSVFYGNGVFITGYDNGSNVYIYRSFDGINWSRTSTSIVFSPSKTLYDAKYANGIWLLNSTGGRLLIYSTDNGSGWSKVGNMMNYMVFCYTKALWLAGASGNDTGLIYSIGWEPTPN